MCHILVPFHPYFFTHSHTHAHTRAFLLAENWIQYALTFVVLLAYFVPLSMIFTVQCVNAFMIYLVHMDIDMYDDTTDTCAEPRSTIVTDLGQIQYIFTDKTGTLTQNVMRFKRCSIDGTSYMLLLLCVSVCVSIYLCMYACIPPGFYLMLLYNFLCLLTKV
jgi:magnesium-transporting ATPase (P-type)